MFIDEVIVTVKAGNGGDGSAAFRREKYIQFGGPDAAEPSPPFPAFTVTITSSINIYLFSLLKFIFYQYILPYFIIIYKFFPLLPLYISTLHPSL